VRGFTSAHSPPPYAMRTLRVHPTGPFFLLSLLPELLAPSNWAYTGRGLARDFVDRILEQTWRTIDGGSW